MPQGAVISPREKAPRMSYVARALVAPIRLYQRFLSPMLGSKCGYHPTCSEYTAQALLRHGVLKGLYLGIRRILRCNPLAKGGFDYVPERFSWRRDQAVHNHPPPSGLTRGEAA
jgi:uncharacterized protein